MAVEMPSRVAMPAGSNSREPIKGLAKLFFRFFTNLAKGLTVQVRG